jgi:hypothetical protein
MAYHSDEPRRPLDVRHPTDRRPLWAALVVVAVLVVAALIGEAITDRTWIGGSGMQTSGQGQQSQKK